jgi:hypothetical protein
MERQEHDKYVNLYHLNFLVASLINDIVIGSSIFFSNSSLPGVYASFHSCSSEICIASFVFPVLTPLLRLPTTHLCFTMR